MIGLTVSGLNRLALALVLTSTLTVAVAALVDRGRSEAAMDAEAVRDVADAALRVAEKHPESFGAVALGEGRAEVIIYRVEPAPALDAALATVRSSLPTGIALTIAPCPFSRRELMALGRKLQEDAPSLRSAGIDVRSWGPQPDASGLAIGVRGNSPEASAALAARYGGDRITVTEAPDAVFLPYQFPTAPPS